MTWKVRDSWLLTESPGDREQLNREMVDKVAQDTTNDDGGEKLGDANEVEREWVILRVPVPLSSHVERVLTFTTLEKNEGLK